MDFHCTNCGKLLNTKEIDKCKCSHCHTCFDPNDPRDLTFVDSNVLVEKLADEYFRLNKKRIDYFETAINILKVYLKNVVCVRKRRFAKFYRVDDMEVTCFLFKLWKHRAEVMIEFDWKVRNKDVVIYKENLRRYEGMKSKLRTTNFRKMIDIVCTVYEKKGQQHKPKRPMRERNFGNILEYKK